MPLDRNATNVKAVEKALVRVLRDNLYNGEELVLIEPFNGPRPKVSYASLMMVSASPEQHEVYEYETKENDEYWESLKGERYCKLRIQFFNTGAGQKAVDCQNLLRSTNRNFDMAPITGFGEIGTAEVFSTNYLGKDEVRAKVDIELYANMSAEYLSNNVEVVKGDIVRDGKEPLPYRTDSDACKLTFHR
jgi:hypothetical protein